MELFGMTHILLRKLCTHMKTDICNQFSRCEMGKLFLFYYFHFLDIVLGNMTARRPILYGRDVKLSYSEGQILTFFKCESFFTDC